MPNQSSSPKNKGSAIASTETYIEKLQAKERAYDVRDSKMNGQTSLT